MISDAIVKEKFLTDIALEELKRLKGEQVSILLENQSKLERLKWDVENLYEYIVNRRIMISQGNGGVTFSFEVAKKLRFIDMKRFKNGKEAPHILIYNRPTWGIIFGSRYSMITRLRSEFTRATQEKIREQMKDFNREKFVTEI
ncbi:MAG: hypothetical protein LBS50_08535 [Prevotellaceae bacterium]|jgi:hypothetical protein|nr:hypothetical protein [Prevotellaceae bacterium]